MTILIWSVAARTSRRARGLGELAGWGSDARMKREKLRGSEGTFPFGAEPGAAAPERVARRKTTGRPRGWPTRTESGRLRHARAARRYGHALLQGAERRHRPPQRGRGGGRGRAALPWSHERLHGKGGLDGSGPREGAARDGRSGSSDPGGAARAAGGSGPESHLAPNRFNSWICPA